ncbi:MAG: phage tail protein [Chromatiaceae bacterium]|nr:phage tail protein [Chromatiaceae bacterium]
MSTYLQLGTVRLDLITHVEGFAGQAGYAYAEHAIIEGKSRLQWTGDELQTRTLSCQLHARYCDPQAEYRKLTAAAERHQALKLFFAAGIFEGDYVITAIQRVVEHTDPRGRPYALTLEITLKEYVAPRLVGGSGGDFWGGLGAALLGNNPAGQLLGTALAIAQDPAAFAQAAAQAIGGALLDEAGALGLGLVGDFAENFGPLGPLVNDVGSVIVRQPLDTARALLS